MKKFVTASAFFLLIGLYANSQNTFPATGSAGIGTTSPVASAAFEMRSTKKGILIPRMTTAQRNAIASPVQGLLIFQTDGTAGFYYYSSGWKSLSGAAAAGANTSLSNLASTTSVNSTLLPSATNSKSFGSTSRKWKKGYFSDSVVVKSLIAIDSSNTGVTAYGNLYGVRGTSTSNYGVYGGGGYIGVYGSGGSYGVFGTGTYGLYGSGTYGVYGAGSNSGVYGTAYGSASSGVYGIGSNAFGVTGTSTGNYGGYFTSTNLHGLYAKTSNTNPAAYAAVFQGNTYSYGAYQTSDERVKKNITNLKSGMELINQLQAKSYEFSREGKYANLNLPLGNHYGLLAQDVEKHFPGLVREAPLEVQDVQRPAAQASPSRIPDSTLPNRQSPENIQTLNVKAINYVELIPVIIQALQEVDADKKNLEKQVADLSGEVARLEERIKNLSAKVNGANGTGALTSADLQQNQPNPVTGKTIIPLNIPAKAKNAQLTITQTGSGKIIRTMTVSPGAKQVTVDGSLLSNGSYTYTLVVDGKKIDSRQMTVIQ